MVTWKNVSYLCCESVTDQVDASWMQGLDSQRAVGEVSEFCGEKPSADGEEAVGSGETVAEDEGRDGKTNIAPSTSFQVTEDDTSVGQTSGGLDEGSDSVIIEVMKHMVGEDVINRGVLLEVFTRVVDDAEVF